MRSRRLRRRPRRSMRHVSLGPFSAHERIGSGGMADVWRGEHRSDGVPVAVKVLTERRARNAGFLRRFRGEVRAVAGLDHPGIILLIDHGQVGERAERASGGRQLPGSPAPPPMPETWRQDTPHTPVRLLGVGLGLFGLRTVPLVGRDEEQDRLWGVLAEVRATGRTRLVLLEGTGGCGKSRLARWLCERAHETGAARVLKAVHGPNAGPADGLSPMVAGLLRCGGLTRDEVPDRVRAALALHGVPEPPEVETLVELLTPSREGEPGGVRLESPTERYLVLRHLLAGLGTRRPVVVWLDDVHWGLDALLFAADLLEAGQQADLPVLLVLTARSETLAEEPAASTLVSLLLEDPAAERIEVGMLPEPARPALVRELLGLDGELAAQVEARTAGHPLFAIQVVGDWVQRRVLVPGGRGFALRPGEQARLPDDLHEVWRARVELLLADLPEQAGLALELAAALGRSVDAGEWEGVCRAAAIGAPQQPGACTLLADRLLARRLARPAEPGGGSGWRFVHAMLRESLERAAREAGRWEAHNRLCAAMLEGRTGPRVAERRGRHLLAAGDPDEACEPLLAGVRERLAVDEPRSGARLLSEVEGALARAEDGDPRRGQLLLLRCRHARTTGRLDVAEARARETLAAVRRHGWDDHLAAALLELARTSALVGGDPEQVRGWFEEAVDRAREAADLELLGRARRTLANHLLRLGRVDEAEPLLHQARAASSAAGDGVGEATVLELLGEAAGKRGDPAGAEACLEAARAGYRTAGSRSGLLRAGIRLGDVVRGAGDPARAAALYREAADLGEAIGSGDAAFAAVNLALLLVDSGRWDEARLRLERARAEFERQGRSPLVAAVGAFLLPCLAASGDWPAWDDLLSEARAGLDRSGFVDPDVARAAERAADLAVEAGQRRQAHDALELARAQWLALGETRRAEEAEARLAPHLEAVREGRRTPPRADGRFHGGAGGD